MIGLAKSATDAEVQAAAEYFSALKPKMNIKVIETDTVPKSYVASGHLAAVTNGEKEPIGERIIEVPYDLEHFVSRDSRAHFTAYAPIGSVEKGCALAASSGEGRVACSVCHGPELRGIGPIPGIAELHGSAVVRLQVRRSAGAMAALMKPSVEKLTVADMLSLAAYAASLPP